jgi:hypothetical protein
MDTGEHGRAPSSASSCHNDRQTISSLIQYAQTNYEHNPTEALSALMQALALNSGPASANDAMNRLRDELGDDIVSHVGSRQARMQRALQIVQELVTDESSLLYQLGKQDILRQAMEDGSSVVCTRCQAVVSNARWQQHQRLWCSAIISTGISSDEDTDMSTV